VGAARRTAGAQRHGSKVDDASKFQTYLSRRWAEGCTTGRDLLPEIKYLGYTGSLSQLERLLTQWRHAGQAVASDALAAKTGILSDS
jgi:hypothetical protein